MDSLLTTAPQDVDTRTHATHDRVVPWIVERRKRIATVTARAALVGATLVEIPDDTGQLELILSKWALTRAFRDLDELDLTLDRMGAPR